MVFFTFYACRWKAKNAEDSGYKVSSHRHVRTFLAQSAELTGNFYLFIYFFFADSGQSGNFAKKQPQLSQKRLKQPNLLKSSYHVLFFLNNSDVLRYGRDVNCQDHVHAVFQCVNSDFRMAWLFTKAFWLFLGKEEANMTFLLQEFLMIEHHLSSFD